MKKCCLFFLVVLSLTIILTSPVLSKQVNNTTCQNQINQFEDTTIFTVVNSINSDSIKSNIQLL